MTSYREFVSQEMRNRPEGTPTKEYMKEIAQKWHASKSSPSPSKPLKGGSTEPLLIDSGEGVKKKHHKRTSTTRRRKTPAVMLAPYDSNEEY